MNASPIYVRQRAPPGPSGRGRRRAPRYAGRPTSLRERIATAASDARLRLSIPLDNRGTILPKLRGLPLPELRPPPLGFRPALDRPPSTRDGGRVMSAGRPGRRHRAARRRRIEVAPVGLRHDDRAEVTDQRPKASLAGLEQARDGLRGGDALGRPSAAAVGRRHVPGRRHRRRRSLPVPWPGRQGPPGRVAACRRRRRSRRGSRGRARRARPPVHQRTFERARVVGHADSRAGPSASRPAG